MTKRIFLGFMLTDGNVSLKEGIIRLDLSSKDEETLQVFKRYSGNENKLVIRETENRNQRIFQLRSKKWKEDLAKYSVTPQKTATITLPELSEDLMPHLIRGMFDGDGWISSASCQIGFCGNEKVVTEMRDYLVKTLKVYCVKILHPETNLWQISWASKKTSL